MLCNSLKPLNEAFLKRFGIKYGGKSSMKTFAEESEKKLSNWQF